MKVPLLLGLLCFLVYNANLRLIGTGDALPARYLPLILWRHQTLDLEAEARLVANGRSTIPDWNRPAGAEGKVNYFEPPAYWLVRTREHRLGSLYPVVTPLLVAPLYLPAVIWLDAHGWEQPHVDRVAGLMEKASASLLASIASVLMFLVLRREGLRWGIALSIVFAFGTNTWMISSQALWQHGAGELLVALALLLVVGSGSPIRTALLGAVCVLMAANRPPDALIAGALILFAVWSRRRSALWLLPGAFVPLAALLYYNLDFIGHVVGAYALANGPTTEFFKLSLTGIAGLLVSPTRGLLVFCPFLVFVPLGLIQRWRSASSRGLTVALSLAVAAQFLLYSQADWRAGVSWGPRYLTDLLPILMWMLAPVPVLLRPFTRRVFVLAMAASIAVQAVGAFCYTKASDERIFAGDPASKRGAWNPRNTPFLVELRHPIPRGDLQCNASGSIDRVGATLLSGDGSGDGVVPILETGAVLDGWTALSCGRPPDRLLVLIDGVVIGSVHDFVQRTEVHETENGVPPWGWRVAISTIGVSPGERVLQLAVNVEPGSEVRIVSEQRVVVAEQQPADELAASPLEQASEADLTAMAARAASTLQRQQSRHGFWLTAHTMTLRYEDAEREMNTFLTSMLVDVLSPVAHQWRLDDVVERARRHLAKQVESNGLVRYHGLPDGPTIGTLGAVITPDVDDTALVWKIAGGGAAEPRLQLMLREIARYRDARGLYRTWLAPRENYQNLDPGIDPNPTDLAIQMHVYLMLHELDPAAAQELCSSLQRSYSDGDLWVYYAKAPLVPYLRSFELRNLGCALPPPAERLALPAAGQEVWSEVAYWLTRTASPQAADARQAMRNLLLRIGADDFARVRRSPPLLYHNDLTGTVKRFYWSEDFGRAMWLRLYEASRVEDGQLDQPSP